MSARRVLSCVLAAGLLSGCVTSGEIPLDRIEHRSPADAAALPMAVYPQERDYVRSGQPEWGLALSGGGLRSAFFSAGVLKALFDAGWLDRMEIVSTVSGGGYTAYWLYSNHVASRAQAKFGATSLGAEAFPSRLCELLSRSNFVTYGSLRKIVRRDFRGRSIDLYESGLRRTFGGSDDGLRIDSLAPYMRERANRAPYLIQGATILADDGRPWPARLLEFTPVFYGNANAHRAWDSASSLPLVKTTATSGAAFFPLEQLLEIADPGSASTRVKASDGGKSENLGVFPLVARGVRHIVVADAEHDPGYIFNAYRNLRSGLAMHGMELTIRSIDDHLLFHRGEPFPASFAHGEIRSTPTGKLVSDIYYIKATMPDDLASALAEERLGSEGKISQQRLLDAFDRTRKVGRDWHCENVKAEPFDLTKWSAWNVASYSDTLKKAIMPKVMRAAAAASGVPDVRIEFPQYSTGDQSFYLDQAEAFIGLGYLQSRKFVEALGQR